MRTEPDMSEAAVARRYQEYLERCEVFHPERNRLTLDDYRRAEVEYNEKHDVLWANPDANWGKILYYENLLAV